MNNKILLVDGMALLFRHFYATSVSKQFMRNTNGTPTNGTQGFLRHIMSAINLIQPSHIAVCWDMGATTFRNEIDTNYKQNRTAPPEELIPQFDQVKNVSEALNLFNIGVQNYEADDVIGSLAKHYAKDSNNMIYVMTGDRDLLQCASHNVTIYLIKKGFSEYNLYNEQRFIEEYGLKPRQLVDVKAFMGDTSDGYYGVKGIGERTAIKLLQQYETVDGVLQHLNELTPSQQRKIDDDLESLKRSHQLAMIDCDIPLNYTDIQSNMNYTHDLNHVFNVCDEYELDISKRFIQKLYTQNQ